MPHVGAAGESLNCGRETAGDPLFPAVSSLIARLPLIDVQHKTVINWKKKRKIKHLGWSWCFFSSWWGHVITKFFFFSSASDCSSDYCISGTPKYNLFQEKNPLQWIQLWLRTTNKQKKGGCGNAGYLPELACPRGTKLFLKEWPIKVPEVQHQAVHWEAGDVQNKGRIQHLGDTVGKRWVIIRPTEALDRPFKVRFLWLWQCNCLTDAITLSTYLRQGKQDFH